MHAGFGRRIIGLPELALAAVDRRDVDDATPAALDHRINERLGDVEHGVQVGVQYGIPTGLVELAQRCIAGDAGVVHQDVDPMTVGVDAPRQFLR
ncbi:hypothetical protein SDC9_142235 [bioreactor metagenome]|uniref:Uncharacterized protein n=1 Tax=bioreactor metagenome TaxID=1076179 RepID=A0A645DZX6_9ZZZZ